MSKGIITAKSIRKASRLKDSISLEEDISNLILNSIRFNEVGYLNLLMIVKEFYGPEGNFVIPLKNIPKLKNEIMKLLEEIKSRREVIDFLNSLLSLCNNAIKDNLNIYGFAD
jgi:hypothetical protein